MALRSAAIGADALGGGGLLSRIAASSAPLELPADLVGARAGDELVEHDAQRIDVRRGAERRARDLLRRHVLRRVRAAGELGLSRRPFLPFIQQLGDPEVEQPDLTVAGDEDVRRLEIAVDDEPAVRVADGLHDLPEQAHARGQVERLGRAVLVDERPSTYSSARNGRPPAVTPAS